ncbi:MAG: methyltransferase domain-containing protein [Alphaproteobacteria bacterium]|nr:methyltransferase domain-containing protein [Alphaproteobacteria bacterium]
MTEQLKQIQACFNKASKSYDDVACVQKDSAGFLVNKLLEHQDFVPRNVLDAGTGTGYIPELLLQKFPQTLFYLNDIALEMLEVCKAKFAKTPNIYYIPGDMLELDADLYDCVISNFALQWSSDLQYAINFLHSKSSDIFAFSTLLDGTFNDWHNIISDYQSTKILDYPKAEELISLCTTLKRNDQGFEYWLMDYPLSFNNPIGFMRYLKSLGASAPGNLVRLSNLKKLLKTEAQSLTVTYKIFFGIFRRVSE